MIWIIVPIVAILTPFCYNAYTKWLNLQKLRMNAPLTDDYVTRLTEAEDALESAKRRIENLESIVVNQLVGDSSAQETLNVDATKFIAQKQQNKSS